MPKKKNVWIIWLKYAAYAIKLKWFQRVRVCVCEEDRDKKWEHWTSAVNDFNRQFELANV